MTAHFDTSWVSVLDESIQEWINRYNCPGWIFFPRKHHPFENKYHTIVCDKSKVVYNVEIVEVKYRPRVMDKKDFEQKGGGGWFGGEYDKSFMGYIKVGGRVLRILFTEGLVSMVEKVVLGMD